jgi:oxygen-dependent protoporphyrinogen oxidase
MTEVVIVGGGIAGLAAAYEFARRAVPFVLLEGGARLGGVVLSEPVDGYILDAGPDALLVQKPDAIRLCEELGIGGRLVPTKPPRIAYVQRGGTLHPLPDLSVMGIPTRVGPFLGSRLFSWAGKVRMSAELFVPARRDDEDESIGALMRRRFGREATDYLAEPLLAGIHAGDVDRLSARMLFPRFVEAERTHGSLLLGFRKERVSRPGGADQGAFRSLPGGLSELVEALIATLPPRSIRLNATATRLVRHSGEHGYIVATVSGETVAGRSVVLATPAFVTAGLTRAVNADLARVCDAIPYVSTATISLAFARSAVAHPLNGSGFVVPKVEGSGILAASWMSSKWPGRAPEGHVLVRAFVGGARHPHVLDHSDEQLVTRALGALTPLLGISTPPRLARVYRWMRATAQYEVGHAERVSAVEQALERTPGLYVTGSGFRGTGIPNCIADGRATAAQSAAWLRTVAPCAEESRA